MTRNRCAILLIIATGCSTSSSAEDPLGSRWELDACTWDSSMPLPAEVIIKGNVDTPCLLAIRPTTVTLATSIADPILPVRQFSDGRFVAPTSGGDAVGIWSADGKQVTIFGRRGSGPGEVRNVTSVYVDDDDSLFVADSPLEIEVYDSRGEWVRGLSGIGIQHYESAVVLDSGDLLLSLPHHVANGSFAVVDRLTGKSKAEIGIAPMHSENVRQEERALAYNGGGVFWAATTAGYRLELWGLDGTKRSTIVRDVSWFPEPTQAQVAGDDVRPYVATFALDEKSILWVAILVHVKEASLPSAGSPIDPKRAYDLHVEAFDTKSGKLLYSELFDDPYAFMPPPLFRNGKGMRIRPDDDGILHVNVVQYKLVSNPKH